MIKYYCAHCSSEITSHHGRSRAKHRGHGFCSASCSEQFRTNHDSVWWRVVFKIDIRSDGECWPFKGHLSRGYGVVRRSNKTFLAHRLVYELMNTPIPDGMVVCHSCDNPQCCNPRHLWIGTQTDNMRDMWSKGRGHLSIGNLRHGGKQQ